MNVVLDQNGNTVIMYDNTYELFYNFFLELGVFVNQQGYLQDSDTNIVLRYNDKFIKASLNPNIPIYPGKTDIAFDPAHNFKLISSLLGYYIDKREASEDPIDYGSQGIFDIRDENGIQYHQVFVKTSKGVSYSSKYYHNVYLGFIDCIFKLSGSNVDLSNLDIIEDEE